MIMLCPLILINLIPKNFSERYETNINSLQNNYTSVKVKVMEENKYFKLHSMNINDYVNKQFDNTSSFGLRTLIDRVLSGECVLESYGDTAVVYVSLPTQEVIIQSLQNQVNKSMRFINLYISTANLFQ